MNLGEHLYSCYRYLPSWTLWFWMDYYCCAVLVTSRRWWNWRMSSIFKCQRSWEKWRAGNYKTLHKSSFPSMDFSLLNWIFFGKIFLPHLCIRVYTFHCCDCHFHIFKSMSNFAFSRSSTRSSVCLNKGVTRDWQNLVGCICIMVEISRLANYIFSLH